MISEALIRVSKNYLDAKLNSMSSSSLAPFINKISKEIVKPKIKKTENTTNIEVVVVSTLTGLMYLGLQF